MRTVSGAVAVILVLSVGACSSSKQLEVKETLAPLPADCQPRTYLPGEQLPAGYKTVAKLSFGDTGFSVSCGKDTVREKLRQEACKAGANGIVIKKEKGMDLLSSCYRVDAELISVSQP